MNAIRRILALIHKEFLAILKDPRSRTVVIVPPIVQFLVFGYAATYDLKDVRYAVFDQSRTPESRRLLSMLEGSEAFRLVESLDSERRIPELIDSQEVRLVVRIGPNFAEDLHAGRPADVQIILDGRNSNVASIALGYIGQIVDGFNRSRAPPGAGPSLRLVDRAWFNPNLRSRWFIVSALGGMISMVVVVLLTGLSVAREREQGTFDQLLVTPFTSPQILIGKTVPAFVFGMFDALLLSAGAVLWFGVPMLGSLVGLVAGLTLFILATAGVGLFISSLAATMQQALLGSFMFIMPAVILSGFTTPIENMPRWLQTITLVNPLRFITSALRSVFLEGASTADILPQIVSMAAIAAVTLTAAAWFFRHRAQ